MTPRWRIHLDPCGGIAGDMFCAALAHAMPELQPDLLRCLSQLALPPEIAPRFESHTDHSLAGLRFVVELPGARGPRDEPADAHDHDHDHSHGHSHSHGHGLRPAAPPSSYTRHGHVAHARIRDMLRDSPLRASIREHALGMFQGLAQAEARVHAVSVDEVEFHEVGAWDSIVDIVAAAFWIDALGAACWSHEPVPLGRGMARTAHGMIPLPAPATLHLLEGIEVVDDGIGGERTTPTGAAILRYLHQISENTPLTPLRMRPQASGYGLGTRSLPGRANVLRATLYDLEAQAREATSDHVVRIDFDIDDQSPEDLAVALELLRHRPDVLQVVQVPIFGKKGRLSTRVELLAPEHAREAVTAACFEQTTTIGLRVQTAHRQLLARRELRLGRDAAELRVKVCERDGHSTAKAEMEDLARHAGNHAQREALRRSAEEQALRALPGTQEQQP